MPDSGLTIVCPGSRRRRAGSSGARAERRFVLVAVTGVGVDKASDYNPCDAFVTLRFASENG